MNSLSEEEQNERLRKWIKLSHQLSHGDGLLAHTIQNLGSYDIELIERNKEVLDSFLPETQRPPLRDIYLLDKAISLSRLWVLGAYEDVRMAFIYADAEAKKSGNKKLKEKSEKIQKVKFLFERIRVPLAKHEPAKWHRDTDARFALPVIDKARGIAWKINPDLIITRLELSDTLLNLLDDDLPLFKTS